jgi:putative restriction endonuclease
VISTSAPGIALATATRLTKIAFDNGFDLEGERDGTWLAFKSTQAPLRLWLTAVGETLFIAGLSQLSVANALAAFGTTFTSPLPVGAGSARATTSIAALHELVRRAYQLSRTLPNELLHTFQRKAAGLPTTTEIERLVVQRVGQDVFRDGLMEYWQGRCAITGLGVAAVLRASHIKAWADCTSDAERLDVHNGLLLAANLDALFDKHLISVGDDGVVLVAPGIAAADRALLGLTGVMKVSGLAHGHRGYLAGHRAIFRNTETSHLAEG